MASIEIDGFDDLEELLHDMTITEEDEKKAMKKALEPITNEIEKNAPESTKRLKNQIKSTVKKEDFATVGEIKLGAWYSGFQEFGTSTSKKNVGFFERSVNSTQNDAIQILSRELLK